MTRSASTTSPPAGGAAPVVKTRCSTCRTACRRWGGSAGSTVPNLAPWARSVALARLIRWAASVDHPARRDADQPSARVRRHAFLRPLLGGGEQGFLGCVLAVLQDRSPSQQRREDVWCFSPPHVPHLSGHTRRDAPRPHRRTELDRVSRHETPRRSPGHAPGSRRRSPCRITPRLRVEWIKMTYFIAVPLLNGCGRIGHALTEHGNPGRELDTIDETDPENFRSEPHDTGGASATAHEYSRDSRQGQSGGSRR